MTLARSGHEIAPPARSRAAMSPGPATSIHRRRSDLPREDLSEDISSTDTSSDTGSEVDTSSENATGEDVISDADTHNNSSNDGHSIPRPACKTVGATSSVATTTPIAATPAAPTTGVVPTPATVAATPIAPTDVGLTVPLPP